MRQTKTQRSIDSLLTSMSFFLEHWQNCPKTVCKRCPFYKHERCDFLFLLHKINIPALKGDIKIGKQNCK
jgi:hypothetical protein